MEIAGIPMVQLLYSGIDAFLLLLTDVHTTDDGVVSELHAAMRFSIAGIVIMRQR